jgi:glycine dehydrogenase subunit 2
MLTYDERLIFEKSVSGRIGYHIDTTSFKKVDIPHTFKRTDDLDLPEVSELEVMRHFQHLAQKNFGIETTFYPLGSCTMKYNPKLNDELVSLPGFKDIHPSQPDETIQGFLNLYDDTQSMLSTITGMDAFSLNSFAGAQGEHIGLMIIKAYHQSRNDTQRNIIIVPDNAHGTNPASAVVSGFQVVEIKSNLDGTVNLNALDEVLNDRVAGLMLTNPNTAGVFEKDIEKIADKVHQAGGLLYYDGANLNALVGVARPGDMGFDVMHLNLHKTFSTPHGGGGPGAGPVGVKDFLKPYLPNPQVVKTDNAYARISSPQSIGKVGAFMGNAGVYSRAYVYMMSLGKEHLETMGTYAVLNANYIKASLSEHFNMPLKDYCMHEFVYDGLKDNDDIKTYDIAKRLLDYGIHAPTIYFPLIYKQAMMIEPTEAESKETLDHFINVMRTIVFESKTEPNLLKEAPHTTHVRRLDEAKAARQPILKYKDYKNSTSS